MFPIMDCNKFTEVMSKNKKYSQFTFEGFLLDDFFVKSIISPTDETVSFWADFENNNKNNLEDYHAAKKCIKDANKDLLKDVKVNRIWENIQKANKPVRKLTLFRYAGLVAAASIAVFLFFRLNKLPVHQKEEALYTHDIVDFANKNQPVKPDNAQLIVSNDHVIDLDDLEPEIVCDSASIKTGSIEISKEQSSSFNQLVIPHGKRSVLTLSDETKIWVNSGTRVIFPVDFSKDKREIYLDGEIYLDVAHDSLRPFIVKTDDLTIQVLGTKFNIQAYAEDAQKRIVLESGSVKISSKINSDIFLNPKEMYENDGKNESVKQVDVGVYTSWVDGIYIYEKERLDNILARLSRYYDKKIEIDSVSAGLKCSGKLDLKDNLEEVLNIIKYTAPVSYTNIDGKYSVTYKNKVLME